MFEVKEIEENFKDFQGSLIRDDDSALKDRDEDDEVVRAVQAAAQSGVTALELVELIQEGLSKEPARVMDEILAMRLIYEVCFNIGSIADIEPEEFAEELIRGVDSLWLMAVAGYSYAKCNGKPIQHACLDQYEEQYQDNDSLSSVGPVGSIGILSVSSKDGNRIPKSISLKAKKHIRVGSRMWRVKIADGKLLVGKRALIKWSVKNLGEIKADFPVIGTVDIFKGDHFNWKWSKNQEVNPEEAYTAAKDDERGSFTRWFVLNAVAGKIYAKAKGERNITWWFREQRDTGVEIAPANEMSLETMAKCGALMKVVRKTSSSEKIPSEAVAFAININGKYTTISKDTNGNIKFKANYDVADPSDYEVHKIDQNDISSIGN